MSKCVVLGALAGLLAVAGVAEAQPAIEVAPAELAFPIVRAERDAATLTLAVTNTGTDPDAPFSFHVDGRPWIDPVNFSIAGVCQGADCVAAAGETVSFAITFHPQGNERFDSPISITAPGLDPVVVPFSAQGGFPQLVIDAPAGEFLVLPPVPVGATSTGTITGRNTGPVALRLFSVAPDSPDVAITSGPTTGELGAGVAAAWTVACTPTTAQGTTAFINFDTDANLNPHLVGVSCAGLEASQASVSPGGHDFGVFSVLSPPVQSFTLSNDGAAAIAVGSVSSDAPRDFAITGIAAGATVEPGATLAFDVQPTPTALGRRRATITLGLAPTADVAIAVTALAIDPTMVVETIDDKRDDYALDAGSVDVDAAPQPRRVTLRNQRLSPIAIDGCAVTEPNRSISVRREARGEITSRRGNPRGMTGAAAFALVGGCPGVIAPNATVELTVAFDPDADAVFAGTLTVTGPGIATGALEIPITGRGIDQQIALSEPSLAFADTVRHPSAPATRIVTVTNTGSSTLALTRITVEGEAFSRISPTSATLAPGGSVDITVGFAPVVVGAATGQLVIGNSDDPEIARIDLSGLGIARGVIVAPLALALGTVTVGQPATGAITVRNDDTAAFAIADIAISGDELRLVGPPPATLAPGASVTLTVELTASTAGPRIATLEIFLDNDPDPHAEIAVTALAVAGPPIDPPPGDDGCGCTGGAPSALALAALVAPLVVRRRRRYSRSTQTSPPTTVIG